MEKMLRRGASRKLIAVVVVAVLIAAACGGDDGSIEVQDARYRLSRTDLGAGYFTVTNSTGDDVTLETATAEGVGRIELHESMAADDGTMSMQARPEGFVIPAGQSVSLEPGGKHLMIFDPAASGEDLTIELAFGGETIEVVAAFDEAASAAALGDDSMDEMDHSDDMEEMDDMDDMDEGDG